MFYILSWQTGGVPQIKPVLTPTSRPPITPVAYLSGDPNNGALLFDENCTVCHGAEGEGRIGYVLAKEWPSVRPELTIQTTIERGVAGSPMPAWSLENGGPLSVEEISDIVAFILSLEVIPEVAAPQLAEPESSPWFAGWGGILTGIILFSALVAVILYTQREQEEE
jgi:mono/diheme cytochrome c family protein